MDYLGQRPSISLRHILQQCHHRLLADCDDHKRNRQKGDVGVLKQEIQGVADAVAFAFAVVATAGAPGSQAAGVRQGEGDEDSKELDAETDKHGQSNVDGHEHGAERRRNQLGHQQACLHAQEYCCSSERV